MSEQYLKAYYLGCKLAEQDFYAEQEDENLTSSDKPIDGLTEALESILDKDRGTVSTDVLDSSERPGSATWGDKMELETSKNTGLNV